MFGLLSVSEGSNVCLLWWTLMAKAEAFAYIEQSGLAPFVAIDLQYVLSTLNFSPACLHWPGPRRFHGSRTESPKTCDPGDFQSLRGRSSCYTVPGRDAPMGCSARGLSQRARAHPSRRR